MAVDSPVAARFDPAPDTWTRGGAPIRGIAIHMAEGGGTVSWLKRPDGNSSHYVVEYDGECVQMVRESMAAGSMNPKLTRSSDDAPFTFGGVSIRYGRAALNACLAGWATNPNAAAIAIETEGFAATGPNAKQRVTLARLVADIRRRRGAMPVFGHRDQQAYKACPGHRIPWADYGGHAVRTSTTHIPTGTPVPTPEAAVAIRGSSVPEVPTRVTLRTDPADATKSRWLYVFSDHRVDAGNTQLKPNRPLLLTRFIDADTYAVAYEPSTPDANATSLEMFVHSADIAKTEPIPQALPVPPVDLDAVRLEASRLEWDRLKAGATASVTLPPRP